MARQNINIGTAANDGTGDTLRTTGRKINENFVELYQILGGDSDIAYSNILLGNNQLIFEGLVADDYETTLTAIEPTQDNQITIPDASGQFVLDSATQTLTNKTLVHATLLHPDIADSDNGTSFEYHLIPNSSLAAEVNLTLPLVTANDHLISRTSTDTLTNKRLFSPRLSGVDIRIDSDIHDATGNPVLRIASSPSSINYIQVGGAAVDTDPIIQAIGDDTNVDLRLAGQGIGTVKHLSATRWKDSDAETDGQAINLDNDITFFKGTSGTNTHTLPQGVNRNGHIHTFANIGDAVVIVNVATGYLKHTGYTSFQIQPRHSIQAIYGGANTAREGWYLIGLDSDGGLGSTVVLKS